MHSISPDNCINSRIAALVKEILTTENIQKVIQNGNTMRTKTLVHGWQKVTLGNVSS